MIKRLLVLSTLSLLPTAIPAAVLPGDAAHGKKLHEANCLACHNPGVYTRADRRIGSLEALKEQLSMCSHQLPQSLSNDEVRDVVKYLNDTYYRFK